MRISVSLIRAEDWKNPVTSARFLLLKPNFLACAYACITAGVVCAWQKRQP